MIKFKKMSTTAKVVSGVGVTAVAGVALIPVINTFVDNNKADAKYYEFMNGYYKTKEAAETARSKMTAMSGLVKVMKGDQTIAPNIDLKPLMAEFVSFISKLFVVKVFDMNQQKNGKENFIYNSMTKEEQQKIMEKEIAGQIQYGDLTDITSLVKYASAHKVGNSWMFTPVDEMMLSVLGDGSGQTYSEGELEYASIVKSIERLKTLYTAFYKTHVKDNFNGIAYSLVHGITSRQGDTLTAADHLKGSLNKEGDGSGNTYTEDLILKYQQWGTLKQTVADTGKTLEDFLKDNAIDPALRDAFKRLVASNAKAGWNNDVRYSTDEINLRDLLAKVAVEKKQLAAAMVPGGNLGANIIEGWNWSPSGDETDNVYEDWQLRLAQDMTDRKKLIDGGRTEAPKDAVSGPNPSGSGDGTGRTYDQSLFDLRNDFDTTSDTITQLSQAIHAFELAGTIAAPVGGVKGPNGQHVKPVGLGDDKDYTASYADYTSLQTLQNNIADAKTAEKSFEDALAKAMLDLTPGIPDGSGLTQESKILSDIIKASSVVGENFKQNYNQDQVDLTEAESYKKDIQQQIDELNADGTTPAPDSAVEENNPGRGDMSGKTYTQEEIDLRDLNAQLASINTKIAALKDQKIQQAPTNAQKSGTPYHVDRRGLGDGKTYTPEFVDAVNKYFDYSLKLKGLQAKIAKIEKDFPGLVDPKSGETFADLRDHHAVEGVNTGEQYTQEEIDYTAHMKALEDLQTKLAAATASLSTLKTKANPAYLVILEAEAAHDGAAGTVAPIEGKNQDPVGDADGTIYDAKDVAFDTNLKTLKQNFPNGNPWWTGKSPKTSDEAYFALYNDWKAALQRGTLAVNTEKTGDGTTNKFEDDKFQIYEAFFKETFTKWHNGQSDIGQALQIIADYISKHSTLTPDNGFPLDSESPATTAVSGGTGDKSGYSYMDLTEAIKEYEAAFGTKDASGKVITSPSPEKINYDNIKTTYELLSSNAKLLARYKQQLENNLKIMNDYRSVHNPLVRAKDAAQDDWAPTTGYTAKKGEAEAEQRKLDALRAEFGPGITDDDILKLAALPSVVAATTGFTQAQIDTYNGIDGKIEAARKAAVGASQALADAKSKYPEAYKRYTQLGPNQPIFGTNTAYTGNGAGYSYTQNEIDAREVMKDIKRIIADHIKGDDIQQAVELQRIMAMTSSSSKVNTFVAEGSLSNRGDHTGNTYEQWELDLFHDKVVPYNTYALQKPGDGPVEAPEGAIPLWNDKAVGDGSGNTYSSDEDREFIKNLMPMFNKLFDDKQKAAGKAAGLMSQKAALEGLGMTKTTPTGPYSIGGHTFSTEQYEQAKKFAAQHAVSQPIIAAAEISKQTLADATIALKNYEDAHKDDYDKAFIKWTEANNWVKANIKPGDEIYYTDANIQKAKTAMDKAWNDFKASLTNLKAWFDKNKGKSIGPKGSAFENTKIATDFDTFISQAAKSPDGSYAAIMLALNKVHAIANGKPNAKVPKLHSKEDFDLKAALKKVVQLPAGSTITTDSAEYQTYAFNSLLMMYGKTKGIVGPSPTDGQSEVDFGGGVKYNLCHGLRYAPSDTDPKIAMSNFVKWLYDTFKPETEAVNTPGVGSGKNEKFNSNFFSDDKNQPITTANLDASKLGAAAAEVAADHASVKRMKPGSKPGKNYAPTGDTSGLTYSKDDIAYYNAFVKRAALMQQTQTAQDKVDADKAKWKALQDAGTIPYNQVMERVPDTYTAGAKAKHSDPKGDGTGHDYSHELMEAVKNYYIFEQQAADEQQLIDDLRDDYNKISHTSAYWKSWDKVIDPNYHGVEVGLNNDDLWSQAEIDYRGQAKTVGTIQKSIDALEGKTTPAGGGTPTLPSTGPKVTPAPIGALVGKNDKPAGTHDGKHYDSGQILLRDELKELNQALKELQAKIDSLKTKLSGEGVSQAPDNVHNAVPDSEWHKVAVGDGSGNTYSQQIFDDIAKLQKLKDDLTEAIQKRDDFIKLKGQAWMDTIAQEIKNGMVSGVNYAIKYSEAEIELRDDRVELLKLQKYLGSLNADANIKLAQSLILGKSKVGENIAPKGAKNDQKYDDKQIKLRDLEEKIAGEEKLHGIIDENDMAVVNKFDDLEQDQSKAVKSKTLAVTVRYFYENLDLSRAKVGANHSASGDESDTYYTQSDIDAFKDAKTLQQLLSDNLDAIKALQAKGTRVAPKGGLSITHEESMKAVGDDSLVGKHKEAVGDASGNIYAAAPAVKPSDQDKLKDIDLAREYVNKQKAKDDAQAALDKFIADNKNEVEFFKFKEIGGNGWHPIVGVNYSDKQFELAKEIKDRDDLKIGKTMVNVNPDATPSSFGTNRGDMFKDTADHDRQVIYQGDDSSDQIESEVMGSDSVRIGYVLDPSGAATPSDDAPVLTSLESVAKYLEKHPDLAPDSLIKKFAVLQTLSKSKDDEDLEIHEVTISEDRYRAMQDNYKWGDK